MSQDIHRTILSFIPFKSILRCKSVSKAWLSLITGPDFVKRHLARSTGRKDNHHRPLLLVTSQGDYCISDGNGGEAVQFELPFGEYMGNTFMVQVGYCNGLLCICRTGSKDYKTVITLWNPSTSEYENLPYSHPQVPLQPDDHVYWGFGFHPKTEEYKVVRISSSSNKLKIQSRVHVYTVGGTSSWRKLGNIPYVLSGASSKPLVFNGVLHWFALSGTKKNIILSFHIDNEKFREVALNAESDDKYGLNFDLYCRSLGVLGGCLSMLGSFDLYNYAIWILKDYGAKEQSWTKKFTITSKIFLNICWSPPWLLDDGLVVFQDLLELRSYSPPDYNTITRTVDNCGTYHFEMVEDFVESVLSPKQLRRQRVI